MNELTLNEITILIRLVKSGRVEYTTSAPLLVKLENQRDFLTHGKPLVKRDDYVGGPTARSFGPFW